MSFCEDLEIILTICDKNLITCYYIENLNNRCYLICIKWKYEISPSKINEYLRELALKFREENILNTLKRKGNGFKIEENINKEQKGYECLRDYLQICKYIVQGVVEVAQRIVEDVEPIIICVDENDKIRVINRFHYYWIYETILSRNVYIIFDPFFHTPYIFGEMVLSFKRIAGKENYLSKTYEKVREFMTEKFSLFRVFIENIICKFCNTIRICDIDLMENSIKNFLNNCVTAFYKDDRCDLYYYIK